MTMAPLTVDFVNQIVDEALADSTTTHPLASSSSSSPSPSTGAAGDGGDGGGSGGGGGDHKNNRRHLGGVEFRRVVTDEEWRSLAALSAGSTARAGGRRGADPTPGDPPVATQQQKRQQFPHDQRPCSPPNIPFYFGIEATTKGGAAHEEAASAVVAFVTFYIAYSTWDGRMTYVDDLVVVEDGGTGFDHGSDGTPQKYDFDGLKVTLYRLLAKISVSIGCDRLTWKVR
jgi:hypothetical protein